jgi:predicted dehydrogenase
MLQLKKVIRFISIYGIKRTFVKVIGRTRLSISLPNFKKRRDISIIGCGQFAFSTIAFFLYFNKKRTFLGTFDIDETKSKTLARFFRFKKTYRDPQSLISDKRCKLIYIASNHSTHTLYAIEALRKNIDIYIEKPLSTTVEQFQALLHAKNDSSSKVFVGYNRPFSKAILLLSKKIENTNSSLSLSCFISGHLIEQDHWYRNPEEGTRVCGNMGHWIDLGVHLLNKKGDLPDYFEINISYANYEESDDNVCVTISTDKNDIISIFLTSRTEPFEGINETINLQCGEIIAKIDDFRKMYIWKGTKKITKRYWPKDVGHRKAILQPFNKYSRDFSEIEISTILMLRIKEMVLSKTNMLKININEEFKIYL